MSDITFEPIQEKDLPEVSEIYNHYVLNTTATFHAHKMEVEEYRGMVLFEDDKYVTYVVRDSGATVGYVQLTQHKKREAYDGTAEITVYLKPGLTRRGLGSSAIKFIEGVAREKGLHVLVATICGENAASIGVFAKNGYEKCAHYKEVGQKFGQLLDVVAYQKIL